MADRRATLFVGVEGWQEAANAADKVDEAWKKAGSGIGSAFSKVGDIVGGAVTGMISDVTRLLTVAQGISFAKGVSEARAYTDQLGRMAVSGNVSLSSLENSFTALSKQKLVPEKQIGAFVSAVRSATYDVKGARDSFAGLADEAVNTGKSADQMVPLGVLLHNTLGITGDTTQALGRMRAQAELLGTAGGPAALEDTLVSISGVLQNISDKTPGIAGKMSALAGGFGGAGLKPQQRSEALNSVLGKVQGDQFGWIHTFLGKNLSDYQDAQGRIKDPERLLADVQAKFRKRYGTGEQARIKAQNTFGSIGGMALLNTNFGGIEAAANAPSIDGRAQSFYEGEAGQQLRAQQAKDRAERELGKKVNPYVTDVQGFIADNPILGTLGLGIGGQLVGAGAGALVKGGFGALGNALGGAGGVGAEMPSLGTGGAVPVSVTNASEISGGIMGVLGRGGLLAVAGGAGYAVGTVADRTLGISDDIVNRSFAPIGDIQDSASQQWAAKNESDKKSRIAQLEGQGMSHGQAVYASEHGPQFDYERMGASVAKALKNGRSDLLRIETISAVPGVSIAVNGALAGTPKQ